VNDLAGLMLVLWVLFIAFTLLVGRQQWEASSM